MNREDIISMAREAGLSVGPSRDGPDDVRGVGAKLERFAALVEDKFKERLAEAIEQMPFGDTAQSFANYVREFK